MGTKCPGHVECNSSEMEEKKESKGGVNVIELGVPHPLRLEILIGLR